MPGRHGPSCRVAAESLCRETGPGRPTAEPGGWGLPIPTQVIPLAGGHMWTCAEGWGQVELKVGNARFGIRMTSFQTQLCHILSLHFHPSVQSLSRVCLFETPWTAARQASLTITNSQSSLKLMSIGVADAIQPSHPLSSPSPPAPSASQHQDLF